MSAEEANARDAVRTFFVAEKNGLERDMLAGVRRRALYLVSLVTDRALADALRKRLGPAPRAKDLEEAA